jgi:uncharacterized protein with PIN domain
MKTNGLRFTAVCGYCNAELFSFEADVERGMRSEIEATAARESPRRCPVCGARLRGVVEWSNVSVELVPRPVRKLA